MVFRSVYFSIACGERSRPKPDCLKPPNGVVIAELEVGVDPHGAGTQRIGDAVGRIHVAGPHRCRQPVDGIVRYAQRFGFVARKSVTASTGPKISSRATRVSWLHACQVSSPRRNCRRSQAKRLPAAERELRRLRQYRCRCSRAHAACVRSSISAPMLRGFRIERVAEA